VSLLKGLVVGNKLLYSLISPGYNLLNRTRSFGSGNYWSERYVEGGSSGCGSYGRLSVFKADVINGFLKEKGVVSVLDVGCGDAHQTSLFKIPKYTGLDISDECVRLNKKFFAGDDTKRFLKYEPSMPVIHADLVLSLDVIYHLVEDDVFNDYMTYLFGCAERFVMIYSSNKDEQSFCQAQHVRHRRFSDWIRENVPDWELLGFVQNKYPLNGRSDMESFANFYVYAKQSKSKNVGCVEQ